MLLSTFPSVHPLPPGGIGISPVCVSVTIGLSVKIIPSPLAMDYMWLFLKGDARAISLLDPDNLDIRSNCLTGRWFTVTPNVPILSLSVVETFVGSVSMLATVLHVVPILLLRNQHQWAKNELEFTHAETEAGNIGVKAGSIATAYRR